MADLGKKYCVNCLADVTNLRLRCTDCPDIELCPECFSAGAEIGNHRRWHGYQQVDGGRFTLWGPEAEGGWTSREEQSLLDAIEQYGFGNWSFVEPSDVQGGHPTGEEQRRKRLDPQRGVFVERRGHADICGDPSSTILYVLEFLDALARDPDEKRVAVVQSGGDKGVDEFLSIM
ncbi:hypothetical protein PDJAM_G00196280 [Pangasius djambal]|uniref:Uncharacterized protein n=1 Tax=Pangasius djambal TaxID=1691987 RepID=A0ACC5Y603_9TELE|nr:hypothetical protein [Pangasius djambal]